MATLEAELVDRIDDRLQDGNERLGQRLQSLVKGAVEQVVVNISRKVDEAFLLGALGRVVSGVEIRDQYAPEPVEHLPEDRPLASRGVNIDDLLQARAGPDISTVPLERDLGLVNVDQVPSSELFFQALVCGGVPAGRPWHSPPQEMVAGRETEDLVETQIHVLVCLAQRHVVVEHPSGEIVADPDSAGSVLVGRERALAGP